VASDSSVSTFTCLVIIKLKRVFILSGFNSDFAVSCASYIDTLLIMDDGLCCPQKFVDISLMKLHLYQKNNYW